MKKRLVILVTLQPLLGEGLQRIFQNLEDIELISLPCVEIQEIDACFRTTCPDMVLLAGEKEDNAATLLISKMLKHFEDIPIVWVELESNTLHLYTSHSLAANSAELINAIRENDSRKIEVFPMEKKKRSRS